MNYLNQCGCRTILILALTVLLMAASVSGTQASPIDQKGKSAPDSSDGKAMQVDKSAEKEVPLVAPTGCVAPPDTEFGIGIPGWVAGLSGDLGVKGIVTEQDLSFT